MTIDEITRLHAAADAARAAYDTARQTYGGEVHHAHNAYLATIVARNTATIDLQVAAHAWATAPSEAGWLNLLAVWKTLEDTSERDEDSTSL